MTLETIYYITQIIAVLLVIGSLLFVGIQIRDNSRAVKDQNRWTRLTEINATARMLAENPEVLRVNTEASSAAWRGMLQEFAETWGVSFEEAGIVAWTQATYIWTHWAQWRAMKSQHDERELKNIIRFYYSMEPMASVVRQPTSRAVYDPDFIDWLDDVLSSVSVEETQPPSAPEAEPDA